MYSLNEKYERVINSCFDELGGTFSKEQSFHIILGVSAIKWIDMNKRYSSSNLTLKRFINDDDAFRLLQQEMKYFEYQFPKFDGILTGIMDRVYIFKDKSAEKKLQNIFRIIDSINFSSSEEVRSLVNKLTSIGLSLSGAIETPESVKEIITGLADFRRIDAFADYCSGVSGVAVYIYEYLKRNQIDKDVFYYGEEINATLFLISKLLMIINEIDNYEIVNKDVLMDISNDRDLKFDFVVSDFPQLMYADIGFKMNDPRFIYGIPTRSSADWAFCQNVLFHLNDYGKGIVIGTKGTLVRSNEVDIRRGILENDLIESIITLPVNLYEKTSVGTEIIVFNKNKSGDRRRRILFIDASEYSYRLNKNQHAISPEGINKIIEYYKYGIEENHFSKFVDLEKIKEYDYKLNPKEYLDFDVLKNLFDSSVPLKEVAQITRGVQVSKEDLEQLSKQPTHYFLNVKDIENGRISYDETSMITYKKSDWMGKFDIKPGDIILTSKGSTVKIAIVEDDVRPAFISGNLSRIRVDTKKYNPYILYEFFQTEVGIKMIEGLQTGTTIKLLNTAQLERLQIPMFDIEFMNEIGGEIKRNKIEYEKSLEEAKRKFDNNREKFSEILKLHY